jgi:hypothetical protein
MNFATLTRSSYCQDEDGRPVRVAASAVLLIDECQRGSKLTLSGDVTVYVREAPSVVARTLKDAAYGYGRDDAGALVPLGGAA